MNDLFRSLAKERLVWLPELGIGYYPVTAQPYDAAYWERYRALDATPAGEKLTAMRVAMVGMHYGFGPVVDVGIGGGRFLEAHGDARGVDVNPEAIAWLQKRGLWAGDDWRTPAATFWDSLEHIHDPAPLLAHVSEWAFVSMPIYHDADDVLLSKHYRKDEHCWYFTAPGLCEFMGRFGFMCAHRDSREQSAGREGIESFAFRRVRAP